MKMRVGVLQLEDAWTAESVNGLLPAVSEERRQRVLRMARWEDRLRSLAGEQLLRQMLPVGGEEPLRFRYSASGKPALADYPAVQISLSHSGTWAACVLAEQPVGIDIQIYAGVREGVIRRCYTAAEQQYFRQAEDKEKAFYQLWSLKEGFIKMLGRGLAFPLEQVEFTPKAGKVSETMGPDFADFLVFRRDCPEADDPFSGKLSARAYETGRSVSLAVCAASSAEFPETPEWYRLGADGRISPAFPHNAHR